MRPFFSVIMPSYLGEYPGAAKQRESKLIRAIDSLNQQTFTSWELIVVADGCERTCDLIEHNYPGHPKINIRLIKKEPLWSPAVRNGGLEMARGKWVCYLDTDDYFGSQHLERLKAELDHVDTSWAWFNDLTWDNRQKAFVERICDINHKDKHGTSNLVHLEAIKVYWPEGTYKQDAHFATELKASGPGVKIATPEYCVAHIPGRFDI